MRNVDPSTAMCLGADGNETFALAPYPIRYRQGEGASPWVDDEAERVV